MLVHKQIKTLAKPYTDRAMIRLSDRCALGPEDTPVWSNMNVVFFGEPKPKSMPSNFEPSALQPAHMESIQKWCANPRVQVWPVEIGPLHNGDAWSNKSMILLRFVDAKGHSHWFDARYVSAILKRHPDPDWYYSENRLMAKDSTPVTIVANGNGTEITIPEGDPIAILMEWAWGPNPTAAADNYRDWNPNWRLANKCIKTWYVLRWAQRLDRALPKGRRGYKYTRLNGGGPVRRYKNGRHKCIEVASESGQRSVRISLHNGEITNHILKGE